MPQPLQRRSDAEGTVVVVPAFNEAGAVGRVVTELRAVYPAVVVVDDGSSDPTAAVARQAGATVLRHAINRGQGAALQTGITYALRRGAGVIVTFDADGQHRVEDIEALLAALRGGRADVALGSRFLGGTEGMPTARGLLLKAAVLFTRLTTGASLTDAHNGLRAITAEAAAGLSIRMDGMAHASELIDQLHGQGLRYAEVPVTIRYTDYSLAKGQRMTAAFRIARDYLIGKYLP